MACSLTKEGVVNPSRARLNVVHRESTSCQTPVVCRQCEKPACGSVCPVEAISKEKAGSRVSIDYELCIGCKLCLTACPFGGIGFDQVRDMVIKCDLCNGEPACARFCPTSAIQYVDIHQQHMNQKRKTAERWLEAGELKE
jgi:Fe-S-cluster-containing hydrogenase component 2